ncbi:TPA: hypothetical protein ACTDM3_004468 [Salmonella enterica subsp. enterica]
MKKETVLIGGHEIDAGVARDIFNAVHPSVQRVVEALVVAGKTDKEVKTAAKTTAEAVVDTFVILFQTKTKPVSPTDETSQEGR